MNLYLDSSALVKRYLDEEGSDQVLAAMAAADLWLTCRVSYVETARAITLGAGLRHLGPFRDEWPAIAVIEVDQDLAEHAAALTRTDDLRSLDALQLAAALQLSPEDTIVATWDRRLHAAGRRAGLQMLPAALP